MIGFLRFVGIANAAVWLGAMVFFTLSVGPAFFSPEMLHWFGAEKLGELARAYSGNAAQVVVKRYYHFQHGCAVIALVHLLAEWLYLGKPLQKVTVGLLAGLLCLGLAGGFWLQPRLKDLHLTHYSQRVPPLGREQAGRSFRLWHGVARVLDLITLAGVAAYLWRAAHPANPDRYISVDKLRG